MSQVFLIFVTIIFVIILYTILLLRKYFFLVRVSGESMLPVLQEGDFLLAMRNWPTQKIRKGQIIVWVPLFDHPALKKLPYESTQTQYIKRLIGLPGDEIILNQYAKIPMELNGPTSIKIPLGHCFVQGDSPGYDSHTIGPIPLEWIQGIIIFRIKQQNISLKSPRINL